MNRNVKLEQAVREAGGITVVATRVGVSPQALGNWIGRGRVPVVQCAALVDALEGRISKSDLRPEDWQSIWPEHVEHEHRV